ncbi:MAG TPA: hypothetical protein VK917_02140 [Ilumatobacter sp.]|nr:hypothetical protein [Ilumatobacter sp.]
MLTLAGIALLVSGVILTFAAHGGNVGVASKDPQPVAGKTSDRQSDGRILMAGGGEAPTVTTSGSARSA